MRITGAAILSLATLSICWSCAKTRTVPVDLATYSAAPSVDDYFSKIEVVPLSLQEDALLNTEGRFVYAFGKEIIAILDVFSDYCIRIFDYNGAFIKRINRQGIGQGYYYVANDILIDDVYGFLVVLDPTGKFIRYSIADDFSFVDEFHFNGAIKAGHHLAHLANDSYIVYSRTDPNQLFVCSFSDHTITTVDYSTPLGLSLSPFMASITPLYEYNGNAYFCNAIDGHIWTIENSGMKTHVKWDWGDYHLNIEDIPKDKNNSFYARLFNKSSYHCATQFSFAQENDKYILLMFSFRNMEHLLIYDKENNETKVFHHTKEGLRIAIGYCIDKMMYRIVRPNFIHDYIKKELDTNSLYKSHILIKYTFK